MTVVTASLIVCIACTAAGVQGVPAGPDGSTSAQNSVQDRETVTGRLAIVYGDPPPDSGQPAQKRYVVTERQGRQWILTFDADVFPLPNDITSFNGKDVEVQGRRIGTNILLVESIRLL